MSNAAKPVLCHHCKRKEVSHLGGDITCSTKCRTALAKRKETAAGQLTAAGFALVPGILNLWVKNDVHISIDRVIREGIAVFQQHTEVVQEIG
jgi:hypothetical protein